MNRMKGVFRAVFVLLVAFAAALIGTSMARFQSRVEAQGCFMYCGNGGSCLEKSCPYCEDVGGSCGGHTNCFVCTGTL